MRLVFVASVAALLVGAPAAAAPDPSALVLRSSDVPLVYELDRDRSGPYSNARIGKSERIRMLIARTGRVTGYQARWELVQHGSTRSTITSTADLYRDEAGARLSLKLSVAEVGKAGIKGFRPRPLRIGDGGWFAYRKLSDELAWVLWRSGRVVGSVSGFGIRPVETLALARAQQKRIAAATR